MNIPQQKSLAHKNVGKEFLFLSLFYYYKILSVRYKEFTLVVFQLGIENRPFGMGVFLVDGNICHVANGIENVICIDGSILVLGDILTLSCMILTP